MERAAGDLAGRCGSLSEPREELQKCRTHTPLYSNAATAQAEAPQQCWWDQTQHFAYHDAPEVASLETGKEGHTR